MNFYIIVHEYMVRKKMDENSCEGETSESAANVLGGREAKKTDNVSHLENVGVRVEFEGEKLLNQVSDRCGSSIDASASGPSTIFTHAESENNEETLQAAKEEEPLEPISAVLRPELETPQVVQANEEDASAAAISGDPANVERQCSRQLSACEEEGQEDAIVTVGPPPSYSFVMQQKKKSPKSTLLDPAVIDRPLPSPPPPPPTYSGNRGFFLPPAESRLERVCDFPSLAEPLWRSHSQPALCPRCGIIILTTIHSHDSLANHVAALALCLFGCWPCCLLPYCMSACKTTYHHCPICQTFLGVYTPW